MNDEFDMKGNGGAQDGERDRDSLSRNETLKEIPNPYQSAHGADGGTDEAPKDEQPADGEVHNVSAQPEPKKKGRASRTINRIIMIIAIIVFIITASALIKNYVEIKKNQTDMESLAEQVAQKETEVDNTKVGEDGILEKYRSAYNQNNDLVGWIKVPNTTINHPVVKAKNNSQYLRRDFYGAYDKRGTVFMDYRDHADNLCKNTILYGHNFLDSTMFSDLEKYKSIDFYKTAPVIDFNTIYKNYKWKVFAVFMTNADEADDNGYVFNYIYPFMTDDNFDDYIDELAQRSLYFTGVDVRKTDKILTLSTCVRDMDIKGNGQTNARLVVVARLVRSGESESVNTSSVIANDNPRYPQIWYTAHKLDNPYVNAHRWFPEGVEY